MSAAWPVVFASLLLLAGFVLRARVRAMQVIYMPASILGGLLGLGIIQAGLAIPRGAVDGSLSAAGSEVRSAAEFLAGSMSSWPGVLIAVVFAGLLLERPQKLEGRERAGRSVLQAGVYAWLIILGEIAIGLVLAAVVVTPVWGLPPIAGQLIEAGFAGGHGTSAALGRVYVETLGFEGGQDLAFFMATAGLIWSVVSGVALVNIGIRRGWTRGGARFVPSSGLEPRARPEAMALGRVSGDALDPLVFQIGLLGAAVALGALAQAGFAWVVAPERVARIAGAGGWVTESARFLDNLPLFLFTLLGGWGLRHAMAALGIDDLIDTLSMKRLVGVAMEFLIVGAIASLRVEVIGANLGALLVLCGAGFAWAAFCLVVVARRVLPRSCWFELGLINYGMSTGTTAQGMMLLRTVDRDLESGAAEDYALAAPLSAPFVGGGVITFMLPVVVGKVDALWVGLIAGGVVGVLYFAGRGLRGRDSEIGAR